MQRENKRSETLIEKKSRASREHLAERLAKKPAEKKPPMVILDSEKVDFARNCSHHIKASRWTGRLEMQVQALSNNKKLHQQILNIEVIADIGHYNTYNVSCIHVLHDETKMSGTEITSHLREFFGLEQDAECTWQLVNQPNYFKSEFKVSSTNLLYCVTKFEFLPIIRSTQDEVHPKNIPISCHERTNEPISFEAHLNNEAEPKKNTVRSKICFCFQFIIYLFLILTTLFMLWTLIMT